MRCFDLDFVKEEGMKTRRYIYKGVGEAWQGSETEAR